MGLGGLGAPLAFVAMAAAAVLLTLVSSNTAAAVVLIPIALQLATPWGLEAGRLAMVAAVGVSFDFLVPVGTPPNAMARATGLVDVREMLRAGVWITSASVLLLALVAWLAW